MRSYRRKRSSRMVHNLLILRLDGLLNSHDDLSQGLMYMFLYTIACYLSILLYTFSLFYILFYVLIP